MVTVTSERSGWRGNSAPGLMSYRYDRFQGREAQHLRGYRGDLFSVDYQAQVGDGQLLFELTDAAEEPVWDLCVFGDGGERASFALPTDGTYSLVVRGDAARGAFELRWNVEQTARV